MYRYTDITVEGQGPSVDGSYGNVVFFIFFVAMSQFFLMNLFVGVLFMNFEKAQRNEQEAMLLDGDEVKWVDMMKMICNEKPEIIKIPKGKFRRFCYDATQDETPFANFIMFCIIANIVTMAGNYEGMPDNVLQIFEQINYFFTAAFTMEATVKMIAQGCNTYFTIAWNRFDFFVVSASFLDILMNNLSANSLKVIRVGP